MPINEHPDKGVEFEDDWVVASRWDKHVELTCRLPMLPPGRYNVTITVQEAHAASAAPIDVSKYCFHEGCESIREEDFGTDKRVSGFGAAVVYERIPAAAIPKGASLGCDSARAGFCQHAIRVGLFDGRDSACKQCSAIRVPAQDYVRATVDSPHTNATALDVYTLIITPGVTATAPKTSGNLGGNRITISGSGFGAAPPACDPSAVDVTVAGVPCAVTSCTLDSLVCTAGAALVSNNPTPTAPFAGSMGVTVKRWEFGSFNGDWTSTPTTEEPAAGGGKMYFEQPQPFCSTGIIEARREHAKTNQKTKTDTYYLLPAGRSCCHPACGVCTNDYIGSDVGNIDPSLLKTLIGETCAARSRRTGQQCCPSSTKKEPIRFQAHRLNKTLTMSLPEYIQDCPLGSSIRKQLGLDNGDRGYSVHWNVTLATEESTGIRQLTYTRIDAMGPYDSLRIPEEWSDAADCTIAPELAIPAHVACNSRTATGCDMPSGNGAVEVRGFFVPPATGNYSFWVKGSFAAEVLLAEVSKTVELQTGPSILATTVVASTSKRSLNYYDSPAQRSGMQLMKGGETYAFAARQAVNNGDLLLFPEQFMQIGVHSYNSEAVYTPGEKLYHAYRKSIKISTRVTDQMRTGYYRLKIGSLWSSWIHDDSATEKHIKAALESIETVSDVNIIAHEKHHAAVNGRTENGDSWSKLVGAGYTWTVDYINHGDRNEEITISSYDAASDSEKLLPITVPATVTVLRHSGVQDWLLDPAPAYLFREEQAEQPATIFVNGIAAACADDSGCTFAYIDVTPKVTHVDCLDGRGGTPCAAVDAGQVAVRDGNIVRIIGTDFATNTIAQTPETPDDAPEVRFGPVLCKVASFSSTEVICTMPHARVGEHGFTVVARHAGKSETNLQPARYLGRLDSFGDEATGNNRVPVTGGSILVLTGTGFSDVPEENEITVGGRRCVCISATYSQIMCMTPPASEILPEAYGGTLPDDTATAIVSGLFDISPSSPEVVWDWLLTPTFESFAPAVVSAAITSSFEVLGDFNGYSESDTCKHELAFQSPTNNRVCSELKVEDDRARCKMFRGPGFLPTSEQIQTQPQLRLCAASGSRAFAFNGASTKTIDFGLRIESMSPNAGSFAGGTVLTINGAGFGLESDRNVLTGMTMQYEVLSNSVNIETMHRLVPCKILSSTFTQTRCMTQRFTAGGFKEHAPQHGHSGGGINGRLSFKVNTFEIPGVEADPDEHNHDSVDEAHTEVYREYASVAKDSPGSDKGGGGGGGGGLPECAAPTSDSRGQCETCFATAHCIQGYFCSPYMLKCVESSSMACPTPTARCSPRCFVDREGVCTAKAGCPDCTGCNLGKYSWLEWANLDNSATPANQAKTCSQTGAGGAADLVYDRSNSGVVEPDGVVEEGGGYVAPPLDFLTAVQIKEEMGFLMAWINALRTKSDLCVNDALSETAQAHAQMMAGMGMLTHVGAGGETAGIRAINHGYSWAKIYESIAFVPTQSGATAVDLWNRRAGDRDAMIDEDYFEIGIGLHNGFFVALYGAPTDPLEWDAPSDALWRKSAAVVNASYAGTACSMCTGKGSPPADTVYGIASGGNGHGLGGRMVYSCCLTPSTEPGFCLYQSDDKTCKTADFESVCGLGEGYRVGYVRYSDPLKMSKKGASNNGMAREEGCRCGKGLASYLHRGEALIFRGVAFKASDLWASYCVPKVDPDPPPDKNAKRSCSSLVSRRRRGSASPRAKDNGAETYSDVEGNVMTDILLPKVEDNNHVTFDVRDLPKPGVKGRVRFAALGRMLELEVEDVTTKFVSLKGSFAGVSGEVLHRNRWYLGRIIGYSTSRVSLSTRADGGVHGTIQMAQYAGDATAVVEIETSEVGKISAIPRRGDADPNAILRDVRPGFGFENSTAQKRHSRGDGDSELKNTCTVFVDADKWFYDQWGGSGPAWLRKQRTVLKMLDIMLGAMDVFLFNFAASNGPYLYVSGAAVHEGRSFAVENPTALNDPDSSLAAYSSFLHEDAAVKRYRASTDQKGNQVCLNHMFTHVNFGNVVGLASTGTACSQNFQNTAFTSTRSGHGTMSAAGSQGVASHEVGHNWNAEHDCEAPKKSGDGGRCEAFVALASTPDIEAECLAPDDHFIMFPTVSSGANSHRFSPCSKYLIGKMREQLTCLIAAPDGVLPDEFSETTIPTTTTVPIVATMPTTTTRKWWHKYLDDGSSFIGEFDFLGDQTPHLTSISPSAGVCKERVTIVGVGLLSTTHVLMGGEECTNIVAATDTEIQCDPPMLRAGRYHVKVMTASGLAAHPVEHEREVSYVSILRLRALGPRQGSMAGGTAVTIHGDGFGTDPEKVVVQVGDTRAHVVSITDSTIKIITPRYNSKSGYTKSSAAVAVHKVTVPSFQLKKYVNGQYMFHHYGPKGPACAVAYRTMPVVVGGVPKSAVCPQFVTNEYKQPSGFAITNVFRIEHDKDAGTITVYPTSLQDTRCRWFEPFTVQCKTVSDGFMPPSVDIPASIMVNVQSGNMAKDEEYGQLVQVTHSKLRMRPISNCLSCRVPTMSEQANGGLSVTSGTQHVWTPDSYTAMSSSCAASASERGNSTACAFVFVRALTPVLDSVTPATGTLGTRITVHGSGLKPAIARTTVPTVRIGGSDCIVDSPTWTDSSIECIVGKTMAGTHPVILTVSRAGVAVPRGVAFTLKASVLDVQPKRGSYGGGDVVRIDGRGFGGAESTRVAFCGLPCIVESASFHAITCKTTAIHSAESLAAFKNVEHASISPSRTMSDSGSAPAAAAFDGSYVSNYKSANTGRCFVGFDVGEGMHAVVSRIRYFPVSMIPSGRAWMTPGGFAMKGGTFEGANNLTSDKWAVLSTITAPHQGWNWLDVPPAKRGAYRYIRYKGAAKSNCEVSELNFMGVVVHASASCPVTITTQVQDAHPSFGVAAVMPSSTFVDSGGRNFNFVKSVTPVIQSVTPRFGSSLGGTTVTIKGRRLPSQIGNAEATVNSNPCEVQWAATDGSEIRCLTTARGAFLPASISVRHAAADASNAGAGSSVVGATVGLFRYLDRWSEVNTWLNDEPPGEGDSIIVPLDQTLIMDVQPPRLQVILILGVFVFHDSQDLVLDAEYISVEGGKMEIGTEAEPFRHKATITLHGIVKETIGLPGIGGKVLAVKGSPRARSGSVHGGGAWASMRDVGELDIHGAPTASVWAKVQATVSIGAKVVTVAGRVSYTRGNEVVLTNPPEVCTVASASYDGTNSVVVLEKPAEIEHKSSVEFVDGETVDMRCEIGLLSRNVVIQGDSNSSEFGCQTKADPGSEYRIENVEIRWCGQAGYAGSHPIHFNGLGAVAHGASYIRSNSIHHSWNRGIVLSRTSFAEVANNVVYFVEGHGYHVNDLFSQHNVFEANLGIKSMSSLRTDVNAAIFSVFEPKNYWRYNSAADGGTGFGWTMPSGSDSRKNPTLELFANVAHGCSSGISTSNSYTPTSTVYWYNNTFYGNGDFGAKHSEMGDVHHVNTRFAENGYYRGGDIIWAQYVYGADRTRFNPQIRDSYFLGDNRDNRRKSIAISGPGGEYFFVSGATFKNHGANSPAIKGCTGCCSEFGSKQGAYTYRYERLKFVNTPVRVAWACPYKQIHFDIDGTLTGHVNGSVTAYHKFNTWSDDDVCTEKYGSRFSGGTVCNGSVRVRKLFIDHVNPEELDSEPIFLKKSRQQKVASKVVEGGFEMKEEFGGPNFDQWYKDRTLFEHEGECQGEMSVSNGCIEQDHLDFVPFRAASDGYGWAIPVVTHHDYWVDLGGFIDFQTMRMRWSEPFLIEHYATPDDDENVLLKFPYKDYRYRFQVTNDQTSDEQYWFDPSRPWCMGDSCPYAKPQAITPLTRHQAFGSGFIDREDKTLRSSGMYRVVADRSIDDTMLLW